MPTRVRSYSKINLGLAIGPPRPDGFHGLATLYQTVALHDIVTVEARLAHETHISLTTNHPGVPADSRNTAWKMVALALQRAGIVAEVKIHIQKELPVQGGLGAGSANAAAALLGLEKELGVEPGGGGWRDWLSGAARLEIAAQVGSDVPLFLIGGAVLGVGRGEIVSPMPDLPATPCVIAVPEVGVSTPRAFQEWDALCKIGLGEVPSGAKAPDSDGALYGTAEAVPLTKRPAARPSYPSALTSPSPPDRLEELSHVYASVLRPSAPDPSGIVRGIRPESKRGGSEGNGPAEGSQQNGLAGNPLLALVRTGIENDFEQVVFPQYPLLREIKRLLMGPTAGESADSRPFLPDTPGSAMYAALSGSGSALFGLYRTEADAEAAQQRVQAHGCKAIVTSTLPREQYWRTMFAE
jgi:4-diphosphocytidyl-2-C-methyl-D-erythritol kinase